MAWRKRAGDSFEVRGDGAQPRVAVKGRGHEFQARGPRKVHFYEEDVHGDPVHVVHRLVRGGEGPGHRDAVSAGEGAAHELDGLLVGIHDDHAAVDDSSRGHAVQQIHGPWRGWGPSVVSMAGRDERGRSFGQVDGWWQVRVGGALLRPDGTSSGDRLGHPTGASHGMDM